MTNANVVLKLLQRVTCVEIIKAVKKMKLGRAAGSSEMNTEMIVASNKIGVEVMVKLYQRDLDGKEIPNE